MERLASYPAASTENGGNLIFGVAMTMLKAMWLIISDKRTTPVCEMGRAIDNRVLEVLAKISVLDTFIIYNLMATILF